jgi:hypothetical protein
MNTDKTRPVLIGVHLFLSAAQDFDFSARLLG